MSGQTLPEGSTKHLVPPLSSIPDFDGNNSNYGDGHDDDDVNQNTSQDGNNLNDHVIHNPYEPEPNTIWSSPLCHPKYRLHRYIALFFMCCMGFGSYFAYDSPAALQEQITRDMDVSTTSFALLYSLYSWPNVILCFFGGYLIDSVFGIRWGAIIFSFIILIGQLIVAFGAFVNQYWIMEVGRFVFGIGGESLAVAQNTYAVSWFKNKELNLVFGLQLSLSRVGSTVGLNVVAPLYDALKGLNISGHTLLGLVMFVAAATCLFSFICASILGILDKRAERIMQRNDPNNSESLEMIKFKDIRDFNSSFWYLTMICVLYYICIFPFVSLGTVFFRRKYNFDPASANGVDSIIYTISAVACPIFGYLIDVTGRNILWVFLSSIITLVAHAILAFTFVNPWYPMCLMGLGYSILACALWPMVALVIPEHQLGTAYGIMQAVQNLGLAVTPIVAGTLVDAKGYIVLEIFFLGSMSACVLFIVFLFMSDENRGSLLNMSTKQRSDKHEEETRLINAMNAAESSGIMNTSTNGPIMS